MHFMANDNKTQTVMVGTRISQKENARYKKLAAAEHRKVAEVIRMLLAEWAEKKERSAA